MTQNKKSIAWALGVVILTATWATAQCVVRNRGVITSYNNQAAIVATPIVTAIPAYGASYDASALELPKIRDQLAAQEARIKQLEITRDAHVARLAVLEAKLGVTAPALAEPKKDEPANTNGNNLPALVARSCINCHQQGKNPKGGFALVDASGKNLLGITCEQRLDVLRRINLDETSPEVMPPKGKGGAVTDKEAAELLDVLTRNVPKR